MKRLHFPDCMDVTLQLPQEGGTRVTKERERERERERENVTTSFRYSSRLFRTISR